MLDEDQWIQSTDDENIDDESEGSNSNQQYEKTSKVH